VEGNGRGGLSVVFVLARANDVVRLLVREPKNKRRCEQDGFCEWPNENALGMDWRETLNCRPNGHASLGRSTSLKPPTLPEVADKLDESVKTCDLLGN